MSGWKCMQECEALGWGGCQQGMVHQSKQGGPGSIELPQAHPHHTARAAHLYAHGQLGAAGLLHKAAGQADRGQACQVEVDGHQVACGNRGGWPVVGGGMFISPKVAELLAGDISPQSQNLPHTLLTDREFDVFRRIVQGVALTAIAEELSLSVKTVSTHKTHILAKMNMSTQVDLVRYAIDQKLVDE